MVIKNVRFENMKALKIDLSLFCLRVVFTSGVVIRNEQYFTPVTNG